MIHDLHRSEERELVEPDLNSAPAAHDQGGDQRWMTITSSRWRPQEVAA